MARALTLSYRSTAAATAEELAFAMDKVDRRKLYGFVDTESCDEHGRPCELALLAGDGRSLIGRGGSALALLDPDGNYLDRKQLLPVDSHGQPLSRVASSFDAPVALSSRASVADLLDHNIKAAYQLTPPMGASALLAELAGGTIFTFPFSYRGGLDPDVAFLLTNPDGTPFLLLGKPAQLPFVDLKLPAELDADSSTELDDDDSDDVDFAMM